MPGFRRGEAMRRTRRARARRPSCGFTLVEALVAITITAVGGAAILLGVQSSLQTTSHAMEQTVAQGIAQQVLDEALGARYCAHLAHPYETDLGSSDWEAGGVGRERYNDIDDYNGVVSRPPVDAWGMPIGSDDGEGGQRHANFRVASRLFENWQEEIEVYYVDPTDFSRRLPDGQVSDFRAIEVRVVVDNPQRGRRELAHMRQVVAHVPPSG